MRKPSIHALPLLSVMMCASHTVHASDNNLTHDSGRRGSHNKATKRPNNNKSSVIKGQEDRQLFLQNDIPVRKDPPAVSKDNLKFAYKPDWKKKFLFPPSESPTTTPSISSAPTAAPSSTPSEPPSKSISPTGAPSTVSSSAPSSIPSSSPTRTVSYVPGKLTNAQNGLLLSEGLQSRIIARANEKVPLVDGDLSDEVFHGEPDGAAVFAHDNDDGWIYVSNAELMQGEGGVGAIVFNADGEVVEYKKLLRGTSRNCSGGKTPW